MRVLVTDAEYPDLDIEREILLPAGCELLTAQCRTPQDVIQAGAGAEALLVQYAPITREVLQALPSVGLISRFGVGVDTVDLAAAEQAGVWVANVPDYSVVEVASHALAMALSLVRHLAFYDRDVRAGRWHYLSTGTLRRPSLLTFGVLGVGRIGREAAQRARACFGRVLGHDPYLPAERWPVGVTNVGREELFSQSDVISLHAPLNDETRGMVNRGLLERMPAGSYLVNTARGAVVDLDDLFEALEAGRLAGAALDVLPQEPPPPGHPLLRHPRLLLTPHAAFYSLEAEAELRRKAAQNIVAWAAEGRPLYPVVEGRQRRA